MEQQYFTPSIEDIRIGYEMEINYHRGYEESFLPITLSLTDSEGVYNNDLDDILVGLDDGMYEARVPFLSKEQILKEGWNHSGAFYYAWPKDCDSEDSSRPYQWRMNWVDHTRYLKLEFYDNNYFDWFTGYEGPCKDINTLRMLMKLLNIK